MITHRWINVGLTGNDPNFVVLSGVCTTIISHYLNLENFIVQSYWSNFFEKVQIRKCTFYIHIFKLATRWEDNNIKK
jgi:hypothetical protein